MQKRRIILTTVTTKPTYLQLGLYNLKAYAEKYTKIKQKLLIDIHIIKPKKYVAHQDSLYPHLNKPSLLFYAKRFSQKNVSIIGFSCFNWNIDIVLQLCQIIKNVSPRILILLGGPEVSVDPDKILKKEKYIDMIVRDEGEEAFSEILRSVFLKELELENIRGLTYRINRKVINNPRRQLQDLSSIPSPFLNNLIDLSSGDTIVIETSRGCPFGCAYCGYSLSGKNKLRFFPLEKVKNELKYLFDRNVKDLWINDDNLNINLHRAIEILSYIKKYNKNTEITTFLNASMWRMEDNLIRLLKKSRVNSVIGVQSINKKPLRLINRKNEIVAMEDNLKRFDKHKLPYVLQFIAGLPGETYEELKKSIDWASQFSASEIQLFLLRLIRGTSLYVNAKRLGIEQTKLHSHYHRNIKATKEINEKEMLKVYRLIDSINLIYNKGLLKNISRFLMKYCQIKFSDILEEWGKTIRLATYDKKYLKQIQYDFVERLISKNNLKIPEKPINKILSNDLNAFIKNNYFRQVYFSLFQVKEQTG